MATYAHLSDIECAIGRPVPVELSHVVHELLDEAEIRLASVVGNLPDRVLSGSTTADRLRSAVVGMVVDVLPFDSISSDEPLMKLAVGRRERYLAGIPSAADNISLSSMDRPFVRSRPWL